MRLVFQSKYLGTNMSFLILNSYQLLPKLTVFFLCQVGILCFFALVMLLPSYYGASDSREAFMPLKREWVKGGGHGEVGQIMRG